MKKRTYTLSNVVIYHLKHSTVRKLSKEIGISPSTVSRISQRKQIDLPSYFKLCKWLGFNIPLL